MTLHDAFEKSSVTLQSLPSQLAIWSSTRWFTACLCHLMLLIRRYSRYDEYKSDNSRGTASTASILYEASGIWTLDWEKRGALNTRLPVPYVLHKATLSSVSFETLAATRVECASNLAMETAWYNEMSVDCHQATRHRVPDNRILTVELFLLPYSPFLPVVLLLVFYNLLSS